MEIEIDPRIPKPPGSITEAILALGNSDSDAVQKLWDRYFQKLCGFVEGQMYQRHKRHFSADQLAADAFREIAAGLQKNAFNSVRNRDELWQMLMLIASRRTISAGIRQDRLIRGGGNVHGESVFGSGGMENLIDFLERDPGPEEWSELQELKNLLHQRLPTDLHRRIADLRLALYSVAEIAEQVTRTEVNVNHHLQRIRDELRQILRERDAEQ